MKMVVNQDCFSKSVCVEGMTEGDMARPLGVYKSGGDEEPWGGTDHSLDLGSRPRIPL